MSTAAREPIAPLQWLLLGGPFFTVMATWAVIQASPSPSLGNTFVNPSLYLSEHSDDLQRSRVILLLALVGLLAFALALGDRISVAAAGLGAAPLVGASLFAALFFAGDLPLLGAQESVNHDSGQADVGGELYVASLLGALLLVGSTALAGLLHRTVLSNWHVWVSLGTGGMQLITLSAARDSEPFTLGTPYADFTFFLTFAWPMLLGAGLLLRDRVTTFG